MLALTPNAADAIQRITSAPEAPDGAGVRIAAQPTEADQFTLSVAPAPGSDDQVLEQEGARLFLDPGAAAALDDKTLDAQVEPSGVQFFLS